TANNPHGYLTVRQSAWYGTISAPKSGRERTVPLTARGRGTLQAHRHLRGDLVVCTDEGKVLRQDDVDSGLRSICRRGNVRPMGWHLLRHTFASRLAQRGVPLQAIKELLGHSTLTMTLRYAHLAPSNLAQAVAVLETPGDVGVTWGTPHLVTGRFNYEKQGVPDGI
ncbi:MAG: tyrosine-type recombinase/integrase, partial [Desulfomonile tiedjei]|nr:tyrosine-type recombinase/integrase [Desulfomonile tiedjei]